MQDLVHVLILKRHQLELFRRRLSLAKKIDFGAPHVVALLAQVVLIDLLVERVNAFKFFGDGLDPLLSQRTRMHLRYSSVLAHHVGSLLVQMLLVLKQLLLLGCC